MCSFYSLFNESRLEQVQFFPKQKRKKNSRLRDFAFLTSEKLFGNIG